MSTPCTNCGSQNTKKNGTSRGKQRYKCNSCFKSFTPSPGQPGRPCKGDRPMTKAEWFRQYYARLSDAERRAMNNKKNDERRGMPKKPRRVIKSRKRRGTAQ